MKNDWKPRFKCTFRVHMTNEHHEICTMWFAATTREAAKKQAKRYLKKTYGDNFKIISINY